MPIESYDGSAYVAFLDISGFKKLMQDGKNIALEALNLLYESGYDALKPYNENVNGIFISDCGVLFTRNNDDSLVNNLELLLKIITQINNKLIEKNFMLTSSIAYGKFKYEERIEFRGIDKSSLYGGAYVSAYLDNENGKPKIQPGQCRIVMDNFPDKIKQMIEKQDFSNEQFLKMIRKKNRDNDHYYFYWMVKDQIKIEEFEKEYSSLNKSDYKGRIKTLKSYAC